MFRSVMIAAAVIGAAAPALAEGHHSTTSGALAGRSPHHAYVAADAGATCGKQMHSLPAGKPHTYGRHALGAQPCATPELASVKPSTPVAED